MLSLRYQHPAVRDLAWACFSPAMIKTDPKYSDALNCALQLTPERHQWLQALDQDPSTLLTQLGGLTDRRLGIYFERLWHFFLQQDPAVELLAHNLPVRDGGRTLGEFDCLYYCRERGRAVHLELAVKFYLGHRGFWLGTNTRDRLDLKLGHLYQRQIRLGEHPAATRQLQRVGAENPLREIELKGYLFQHDREQQGWPQGYLAQSQQQQHWLPFSRLAPKLDTASRFRVLPRLEWLAPTLAANDCCSGSELQRHLRAHFESGGAACLVAGLQDGEQQCRFFVTSDDWPGDWQAPAMAP